MRGVEPGLWLRRRPPHGGAAKFSGRDRDSMTSDATALVVVVFWERILRSYRVGRGAFYLVRMYGFTVLYGSSTLEAPTDSLFYFLTHARHRNTRASRQDTRRRVYGDLKYSVHARLTPAAKLEMRSQKPKAPF